MPTYDYECTGCQHAFEWFQSISSPVRRKCPVCGELKLKRLIGAGAAVVFKGSGFYQTDYRSESYRKRAAEEKSSTTSTADAKGESPATKDSSAAKPKPKSKTKPAGPGE